MRRIVAIMGTDGSGKTTLSSALVDMLEEEGIDATREWLAAESYIMAPVRKALKMRWRRAGAPDQPTEGAEYSREVAQKHAVVARHLWARRLYLSALLLDYRLQLAFKLFRNGRHAVLVADRYLFDVVVNLALTLGLTPAEAVAFTQRQVARIQLPQVRVFLRVEPEISMQRKHDIPDIDYLRLRLRYYEALATAFGFTTMDGTRPIRENCDRLRDHVIKEFAKPHVHYVHANNEDVGGADFVLVSMARHMRAAKFGYRTTVSLRLPTVAARAHGESGTPVLLASVVRPQVTAGAAGLLKFVVQAPATLLHFLRLFGRERPDLVHVNDLYDFLPACAARLRRIPVVYHIRMIRPGAVRDGFRAMLPLLASKVISVSDAVRRVYDSGGSRSDRHCVIHDLGNSSLVEFSGSVTVNQPRPPGLVAGKRLVLMIGRIQEWKGQLVFLEAVSKLPTELRQQHAFVLAGGGVEGRSDYWGSPEYLDDVLEESQRLGVQWLGPRDDVPALLLSADVSVHCSIRPDPFPGVVVESLLAGTATVASATGGVPEIIQSPEIGLLYCPGDAASLSNHLHRLLTQDIPPRIQYAVAARSRALQLVAPELVDAQVDEVYRSLFKGPSRSSISPAHPKIPSR